MSKLKEEELLEWFKENIDRHAFLQISHPHLAYYATERDKQAYQQIREMILAYAEHQDLTANYIDIVIDLYEQLEQKKLEVDEEFVEKWNQVIAERVNVQMKKDFIREEISLVYPGTENLTQMLKEAGVEVVGSKEEKRQNDNSKD